MSDRLFLDTNILVYAYDKHETRKQKKAQKLLTDGIEQENLFISVQVLGEFFNVVTRHIPQPMTDDEAREIITTLSILPVMEIDLRMVIRAIDTHKAYQISYWDALIVSAAELAGCKMILSEDLNDSQAYHKILVSNPFNGE
ncbi:MAG: PIN domain-containing protein [Deltaproteobacteria bacterium]|nr:PIN domain-containing protein [Deltaproteobacteria bacterium]MBW2154324.1 PIN domain-containing protein [Deltaproteobacteria bacterium]